MTNPWALSLVNVVIFVVESNVSVTLKEGAIGNTYWFDIVITSVAALVIVIDLSLGTLAIL